jgi:phosphoribosylglycinamide formyltransferase-1
MVALADAAREGRIPNAEIAVVISDQANAAGLSKAAELEIRALAIERKGRTREEHDREIITALREHGVELVCLAGYMRILSTQFIEAFRNRILNIHPSLLPAFTGLHPQQHAIDSGVRFSGCTVHIVDESLDGGPIVAQRAIPVHYDDTEESLSARILIEEHKLYPEAVAFIVRGEYEIQGRRVVSKL